MKKLILLLITLLPVTGFSQDHFVIRGTVKNIPSSAKIFMIYRYGEKSKLDSATVKNGEFELVGIVSDTLLATLYVDYKGDGLDDIWGKSNLDELQIYLSPGKINLTSIDSLCNAIFTGSKINEEYYRYNLLMKPVNTEIKKAVTSQQVKLADAERKAVNINFIKENPDSYVSFENALKNDAGDIPDVSKTESEFKLLSENIRSKKATIAYQRYIEVLKRLNIGLIAPEFEAADTSGKQIKLSSFRGKYVLVDFWASWCGPCREENPELVKAFNHYKGQKFTIIGVSLDRPGTKDKWLAAIHKDGLTWAQVSDLKFWNSEIAAAYAVHIIPQNFLLGPDGRIIAKNLSGTDLEDKLEEIFGKI